MSSCILWISPEWKKRLIGVTVQVFIKELSAYKSVQMSPGEAIAYLRTNWADVTIDWLSDDGEIVKTYAKVRKMRNEENQVAICTNENPVIAEAGYQDRKPTNSYFEDWYSAIGCSTHKLLSADPVQIDCNSSENIAYYEGRLNQLLNLGGHDKISRSHRELAAAALGKHYGLNGHPSSR